jgi:hypothetical protein
MKAKNIRLGFELSVCLALFCPSAAHVQSPGFGGGRLVIQSLPVGAHIFINDKPERQVTNFTYVVGQGSYKISVTGGPGNLKCADRQVSVTSGNTVTVTCTAKGWQ